MQRSSAEIAAWAASLADGMWFVFSRASVKEHLLWSREGSLMLFGVILAADSLEEEGLRGGIDSDFTAPALIGVV